MDVIVIYEYQKIAAWLLEKHFGLILNDTSLSDDDVDMGMVGFNIPVYEAINYLVEMYHFDRIEPNCCSLQSPLLTADHSLLLYGNYVGE
ncbi:TA system toxin CbtA family protein [Klebsiella oxytoca]